ncbi:MFS transporter [Halomicrococcus gelatinilyticus]|uniref:MFS transporter n=1 Tax=Halomicrococcus gelatinilyticus TaxID=1702103 RepID=UPI002E0D246E
MADRLIGKYYCFQATRSVGFISPIFTLFVLRDVSFTQYGTLSALSAALVVLGEVPTGYVGDRYGRRTSLALSVVFTVLSLAGFVVAQSYWPYVLFYVLWALALAFASGSADAWLYEVLDEHFDADDFVRVRGRGASVMRWTSVATMIGGGALYAVDPRYPFVASLALNGLGLAVLFTLPSTRRRANDDRSAGDPADGPGIDDATRDPGADDADADADGHITLLETLPLVRRQFTARPLRPFVVYVGLFFAVTTAADAYIQPVTEELFRATLESATVAGHSLPLGVVLGVLYAGFTAVSAVASYFAGDVEAALGLWGALLVVPAVTAVTLVLPRLAIVAALPMFVALRGSKALLLPIVNGHLNDHVGSAGRATTLSAFSMLWRLLRVPMVLAAGVVADAVTETAAVAMLGVVFLVGASVTWLVDSPVGRSTTT